MLVSVIDVVLECVRLHKSEGEEVTGEDEVTLAVRLVVYSTVTVGDDVHRLDRVRVSVKVTFSDAVEDLLPVWDLEGEEVATLVMLCEIKSVSVIELGEDDVGLSVLVCEGVSVRRVFEEPSTLVSDCEALDDKVAVILDKDGVLDRVSVFVLV